MILKNVRKKEISSNEEEIFKIIHSIKIDKIANNIIICIKLEKCKIQAFSESILQYIKYNHVCIAKKNPGEHVNQPPMPYKQ